jgi:hypothetical protein
VDKIPNCVRLQLRAALENKAFCCARVDIIRLFLSQKRAPSDKNRDRNGDWEHRLATGAGRFDFEF